MKQLWSKYGSYVQICLFKSPKYLNNENLFYNKKEFDKYIMSVKVVKQIT
jgi:hypothetical protein